VLLDLGLPDLPGQEVLTRILASRPWLPVIMLTGQLDAEAALQCLRLGARDYLTKPYQLPHLSGALQRELHRSGLARRLRALRAQGEQRGLERLQGDSAGLQQARALLQRAAGVDIGVLLSGETGTGKDLAAQALHEASPRAKGPLVALDCGALPEKLLDAELFGHEKGAFTGADAAKKGRIEMAQGGTLFLDEVGELSLESQARLMRVLQERCLRRVGGSSDIPVDIRVVAATHVDLAEARRDGRFREDLYHRLAEFVVHLPPLRERGKDIVELAQSLLQVAALAFEKPVAGISPEARIDACDAPGPDPLRRERGLGRPAGPDRGPQHRPGGGRRPLGPSAAERLGCGRKSDGGQGP
jgi:DNA-binding NtrC family response regulator